MKIGEDYDKIEFEMFGLDLLEPNALIGDFILLLIAIYLGLKVNKLNSSMPFFRGWVLFFFTLGISLFLGGLGHCLFLYFGAPGRYAGWLGSIISVMFLEHAIFSLYSNQEKAKRLKLLSTIKMFLAIIAEIIIFSKLNLNEMQQRGLWVPMISSSIGFIYCLGFLANNYKKKITESFKFLEISLLFMIPAALVQAMKISIYPWFDRNDISHCFLVITLFMYWKAIEGYHNFLGQDLIYQNKK